ncbi:uncharacterized protein K02A2.6-like isoform X1 [Diaphorina citri]|uniref:RNA-directed DNA polymerase n=1 Tax=Diaphorina citri TaxID=121845 RepID=A0A3Q0JK14_DIACI|nr:uncharacterized protein K02A2.6-like isoform X1 [Diaphorina citri]
MTKGKFPCCYLLHHMGGEVLDIFKSFNLDLDQVTHEALLKKFSDYFSPKKNITMERNRFFTKRQSPDQNIMEFVTELRNLAKSCEFPETDSIVRDIFICNMRNDYNYVKQKLLEDGNLTLEKALEVATSLVASREHVSILETDSNEINKIYHQSRNFNRGRSSSQDHRSQGHQRSVSRQSNKNGQSSQTSSQLTTSCQKCGQIHRVRCPAWGKTCAKCGRRNHFAKMCKIMSVKNIGEHYVNEELPIQEFHVGSIQSANSWDIEMEINGQVTSAQVDTGSQVNIISRYMYSVLNLNLKNILPCNNVRLTSYSQNRIPVMGTALIKCKILSSQINVTQSIEFFVTSIDQKTILGLSTCEKLGLIKRNFLVNNSNDNDYSQLLEKYDHLFEGIGLLPGLYSIPFDKSAPKHIDPPRKCPFRIKAKVKKELDSMLEQGILSKVNEPCDYISSITCPEKDDGSLRVCLDPRFINKYVIRSKLSIPTLDSLISEVSGSQIFSVLDLKSGFWSLKLDPESSKLTSFNTEFGVFSFNRMPFGICVASEVFQHALQNLLRDIPNIQIYIDDILIFAKDKVQHDEILNKIFEKASEIGLKFNKKKLQLGKSSVKFMGHIISKDGVLPQDSKIKAIENMQAPTNVKELQRFLGVVNYLGKFIKNLSQLTVSLRSSLKKNTSWSWTPNHQAEFENLKKIISSVPVLTYFDPNKPLTLSVDSSCSSMGAVLMHGQNPIAYASKSLSDCQQRYSQIEKELLAIVFGCVKYHSYIYGQSVTVHTDHKPLISIFKKSLSDVPCRLQRMMLKLQGYDLNVIHVPGKHMYIADTLSRANIKNNNESEEIDEVFKKLDKNLRIHGNSLIHSINVSDNKLEQIKVKTDNDPQLSRVKCCVLDGWPPKNKVDDDLRQFYSFKDDLHLVDGILFKKRSILIPASLRKEMLQRMHTGHLGIQKTKQLVRGVIYWPGMNEDISHMIDSCPVCLKFRKSNQKQPLLPHTIPSLPWQKLGMDLFHFESKNYLIMVDYYSQYFEICCVNSYNAQTIITQCKSVWSRHGIPCQIVSDGGPPFNSQDFARFCQSWDIEHVKTSPHYSKSNGLVERTIQSVKNIMKKCKESNSDVYLGLLQFRNAPKAEGIESPAKLLMSRQLRSNIPTSESTLKPSPINIENEKQKNVQETK